MKILGLQLNLRHAVFIHHGEHCRPAFGFDPLLHLIISGEPNQGIAAADIEINVRQWFDQVRAFHLGNHLQKEPEFADLHGFGHDVHPVKVVQDNGLHDEIALVGVFRHPRKLCFEIAEFLRMVFDAGLIKLGRKGLHAVKAGLI
ncbi:MAG: hypothetical protein JRD04_06385 [Deltaproteobacteria bacterium]|nr:hypothetical protein [Deltaproteobacteria bacterium]